MNRVVRRALIALAGISGTALIAGAASAASNPTGVWIDHTGRGAVEISQCDEGLCGRIVWLETSMPGKACGLEIIGNVKPVAAGLWDDGWILDPEYGDKFDVEIKPLAGDQLQVTGYMGIKSLSETMIWKRAPANLSRC